MPLPFFERLTSHGSRTCVVDGGKGVTPQQYTYGDLLQAAACVSAALRERAAGGDRVAYLASPGFKYVATEVGVWAAGMVAVPMSLHSPKPELEYAITDSGAAVLVATKDLAAKLTELSQELNLPLLVADELVAKGGDSGAVVESSVEVADPALILYTSGTTGKPKGVLHTHKSIMAQLTSLNEAWCWTQEDKTLHCLPLHHIHGVNNILNTALWSGACVEFSAFDASHILTRLTAGDITCFHAVPTIYHKLQKHWDTLPADQQESASTGLRQLRLMVCGSAALPVPAMQAWAKISGQVLLERYGMTEIGMALSNSYAAARIPGCVGRPLPGVEIRIAEDGELRIKGPNVFREYWKRPDATREAFDEDGWFRTGDTVQVGGSEADLEASRQGAVDVAEAAGRDLGTMPDLSQTLRIMGRTSVDIIKSGGYKLSALEIESGLLTHPSIAEVAVVGMPDEEWGEKVTAVVVSQPGAEPPLELKTLRAWGKDRMAVYKVPHALHTVEALPRNVMGKIEKKRIIQMLTEGQA